MADQEQEDEGKVPSGNSIGALVRKAENDYRNGYTQISKYVNFSQHENIEKIDAYLNSKHISGEFDNLDREKPFFNIVLAARNIWWRATDIDRKNIKIKATKMKHRVMAYVASMLLQDWMKKSGFGIFLNEWGLSLANYGSSPVEFVEKGDDLSANVLSWNNLISDTVDFENNPRIKVLYLNAAQLKKNKLYDQNVVDDLIDAQSEARKTADGQQKDNKSDYFKIYEVHGDMPWSFNTGDKKDDETYVQQMFAFSYITNAKDKDEFDDFVLFKGREAKDPQMLTHLIPQDGRAQSIGSVEYLFESQWMTNHSQKLIKDQIDFTSKVILQSADGNFVGMNVLTDLEVGDVLTHAPNAPLTLVANRGDISSLQAFGKQWEQLAQQLTSTPDALRGENQPAGTAWRQVEALQTESHSLFEQMIENKGLAIEQMLREYVIPHLKKQMDTTEELAMTLDSQGIKEFDAMFVPNEVIKRANDIKKKAILSGQVATEPDPSQIETQVKQHLSELGNKRYLKPSDIDSVTWKEALKDLEWEVEVDVTGESKDHEAAMTTLTTVLKTIASNPNILQDPNMKMLFNKILEETDAISPLEFSQVAPPQNQPNNKLIESMNYKDAPSDIQRQIETQAGFQPSQVNAAPAAPAASVPPTQIQPIQ